MTLVFTKELVFEGNSVNNNDQNFLITNHIPKNLNLTIMFYDF
jgi:hypothetical protein